MTDKDGQRPWFIPILAVLILTTVFMSKAGITGNIILIPVAAAFLMGFGVLIGAAVKQWKKTDEQVLDEYEELAVFFSGNRQISLAERKKHFLGALSVTGFALVRTKGDWKSLVFVVLTLILFGIPLLVAWKSRKGNQERKVRTETIIALILGLISCGFFCTFIGIGVYHGVWWFVCPPGLVFLSFFSRPLVAAVRTLLGVSTPRDRGEGHVRREKELDPWDRPDKKY